MTRPLMIPAAVRLLVYERAHENCERCFRWARGGSAHHRFARGMGGSRDPRINDPRNIVLLCGSGVTGCHGWIEHHPEQGRQEGWLIDTLEEAQLDRPMADIAGRWFQLTKEGGRVGHPGPSGPEEYRDF